MKQPVISVHFFQDGFHFMLIGMRNKYLAEMYIRYKFDDLPHTAFIKFVKYIIQQQNGQGPVHGFYEIELRQFKRHGKGFCCP